MQVSKGLKRATGRDEQVQHHLGTLNFWPARLQLSSLLTSKLSSRPERSAVEGSAFGQFVTRDFGDGHNFHFVVRC